MRTRLTAAMLAGLLLLGASAGEGHPSVDDVDDYIQMTTRDAHVLVLGASRDYASVERLARRIAGRMNMPFSTRGMRWDALRGLIDPEVGHYYFRRYETDDDGKAFISVERSDSYPGMRPGFYFIMGGIDPAGPRVTAFRPVVKDAYAARTKLYMGCMH